MDFVENFFLTTKELQDLDFKKYILKAIGDIIRGLLKNVYLTEFFFFGFTIIFFREISK